MNKKADRKYIVSCINRAARAYKNFLVGRKFLYIFDGRYIEVIFKTSNFCHLTGVATNLSAKTFYKLAVNGKLQGNQIYFTAKHPYSLCMRKIKHIQNLASMVTSEAFMLEEIITNTRTYKFGTTDLHFSVCLNKEFDSNGDELNECYISESLRDEDCFSKSKHAFCITHIFSKPNNIATYTNLLYVDFNYKTSIPKEVVPMLSEDLLTELNINSGI